MFVTNVRFKPFINKGADCDNVFDGVPPFQLIGLMFDSSIKYYMPPRSKYCIVQKCDGCNK